MADPRIPNPRQVESYDIAWHAQAACREADPEIFFPTNLEQQRDGAGKALEFCGACPVWAECLKWALENREMGTWGGLTQAERQRLRLTRRHYTTTATLKHTLTEVIPECAECQKHRRSVASSDEGICDPCATARRRRENRPKCSRLDCEAVQYAKDLCKKHYQSEIKKGTIKRAEVAA